MTQNVKSPRLLSTFFCLHNDMDFIVILFQGVLPSILCMRTCFEIVGAEMSMDTPFYAHFLISNTLKYI